MLLTFGVNHIQKRMRIAVCFRELPDILGSKSTKGFTVDILRAILSKKTAFDGVRANFKTGLPALVVLLLCLVIQSPLHAQEQDTATSKKLFYIALKNNLLYDAALLPNLTAEVYLGKQFSLAIDGNWSWWTFKSDRFHRIQSAGTEFRYWINSPYPLRGHAVGIYSMVGDYDIRLFTKSKYSTGWLSYGSWSAGLSYAYSMPIANRVNLELGLAVGYLGGKYYDYNYCTTHERWEWQTEYNRKYFGPTRIGVSIVWLLGNGYRELKN